MLNSYIALGYACNHNCINCPLSTYDRLHGQLSKTDIVQNISKLLESGEEIHVVLSGGEPTLSPYFLDVLRILGSVNAHIVVLSNLSLCTDPIFIHKVIDSLGEGYDLSRFKFITALHSMDDKVHDSMTGVQGSYKDSRNAIDNLMHYRIPVIVKNIMSKKSAPTLSKMVDYFSCQYPPSLGLELCSMDYSGRCGKHKDELFITFTDLQPYLEESLDTFELKAITGKTLNIIETPLCAVDPYYWKYFQLRENDNLAYIAPNEHAPNHLLESYSGSCSTDFRECSECDLKTFCPGIWGSTYVLSDNKDSIVRPVKVLK